MMKARWMLPVALMAFCAGSLCAAEGFFVAIGGENTKGADGHAIEAEFGTVYLSNDGKAWENVFRGGPVVKDFSHSNNNLLRDLAYGKDTFVVVGNAGVMSSKDGRDWKQADERKSFCVAFGNGIFIAPSAAVILRSEDGVTWQQSKPESVKKVWGKDGAGHIRKVVFGNGVFVCIGEKRLSVTKDGKTYTHHEAFPDKPLRGYSLIFGAGRFVWLRKDGHLTSVDGVKWEPIKFADADSRPDSIGIWTGKEFLAAGKGCMWRSADGLTWVKTAATGTPRPEAIGNDVILGRSGPSWFYISADAGKTWQRAKTKIDVWSRKVYFFDGKQIIGTGGG
jgi:hypothetical protein